MRQVAEEAREVDGLRFNGEGSCESLWNVVQEEVRLQEQLWNCLIVRGFEKNAVLCVRGCGCVIDARFRFLTIVWEFFAT